MGQTIPQSSVIENLESIVTSAQFVLLVEKECTYRRLVNEKFHLNNNCLLVTGKGYPDLATRFFLQRLYQFTGLNVLVLVDMDPYGIEILMTYAVGSISQSYNPEQPHIPSVKWIGIHPSDLFLVPHNCSMALTVKDVQKAKELMASSQVANWPDWREEISVLLSQGQKVEIENLCGLVEYISTKLKQQKWL